MSLDTVGLRFFSLRAEVRTDVEVVARYTRDLFGQFVVNDPSAPDYRLEILRQGGGRCHVADGELDAEVAETRSLTGIVAARLLETAGNEIAEPDLFHAAALERAGRGLMICGESGHGKSTLGLGLLDHGYRLLSDEVGAVDRNGMLLPFPKALELRAGNVALPCPRGGRPGRAGKTLFELAELGDGTPARSCPLSGIVFLDSDRADREPGRIALTLHRRAEALPAALESVNGITDATWIDDGPVLDIRFDPARFAAWTLPEHVAHHGVLIVDSSADAPPPATFDRDPVLEPLPAPEGLKRLLAQYRGTKALPRRLAAHNNDFAGVFLDRLDRLANTRFARLRPGHLPPTLEALSHWGQVL